MSIAIVSHAPRIGMYCKGMCYLGIVSKAYSKYPDGIVSTCIVCSAYMTLLYFHKTLFRRDCNSKCMRGSRNFRRREGDPSPPDKKAEGI